VLHLLPGKGQDSGLADIETGIQVAATIVTCSWGVKYTDATGRRGQQYQDGHEGQAQWRPIHHLTILLIFKDFIAYDIYIHSFDVWKKPTISMFMHYHSDYRPGLIMDFYETLDKRRSVRAFKETDVEAEKLDRILKAVVLAPTAGNLQSYRILVVKDQKKRAALARAAWDQGFVRQAPVVLIFSTVASESAVRYGTRGVELYTIQDATIATTFAHLAAVVEGLGSCWVGAFDTKEVIKAAGLPKGHVPVALLPIGYPKKVPGRTSRNSFDEMVTFD
jgi:nitroreductase